MNPLTFAFSRSVLLAIVLSVSLGGPKGRAADIRYEHLADCITRALELQKGERVLLRYDSDYFAELRGPLESRIRRAGAVVLGPLEYQAKGVPPLGFGEVIEDADVYLWLPLRPDLHEVSPQEREALQRWLEKGGARREIHFHWQEGSVLSDGLPGPHSPALDQIYQAALDIDYSALSAAQDRAIALLRSGTIHVTTPAGTDLRFRVGSRPFNKQDGDASPARARAARVRVDREIELPAGVLRVAPLEETVNGTLVIPSARFGSAVARRLRFSIRNGVITSIQADQNLDAARAALAAGGEAALHFREFGLGFNPKLQAPPESPSLAYYGYGAGVVRLSLGDNQELGGNVRGGFTRWFFFPDGTVEVGGRILVRGGRLSSAGTP
ncbi:MAG TPA: hypothetical protein VFA54_15765 [Bryobacterales bacterium]|jgi:hypothetical protein|nr:hypothetical protein [Bryobacterales bacterium]